MSVAISINILKTMVVKFYLSDIVSRDSRADVLAW